jgi:hypothetical protein
MLRILGVFLFFVFGLMPAVAQHNHGEGHHDYLTWSSTKTDNCCNNQDCGELKDDEWRETNTGIEIKIAEQWCPVRQEHFIIRGKSPDWSKAHACIQADVNFSTGRKSPCERLLCFAATPKF